MAKSIKPGVPREGDHPEIYVTAVEVNRNFGVLQKNVRHGPVIVTRHGRASLAVLSATQFDALRATAAGQSERGSRRKLLILLDRMREGYVSVGEDLNIVMVNRAAEMLLGRTREELTGKPFAEALPNGVWPDASAQIEHVISNGTVLTRDVAFHAYKSWHVEVQAFPLPTPSGGAGVLLHNVSDLRAYETTAVEAEQRARTLAALLDRCAVLEVDARTRVTGWNAGAESLLGYEASAVLGKALAELVDVSSRKKLGELAMVSERNVSQPLPVSSFIHRDGRRLVLAGTVVRSNDGWALMLSVTGETERFAETNY